ncbi:uncharacterized PE-PGRS family protein PE_PGRS46-like [Mercenaria mercenaria]|uniref:uncharacterized PE-PGRS family protein PE_PGRS46-like n=1 Tax=Mercenaria mercenaria TaxID=6596 RepID=UPI00234E40AF|nr:uncharacterized PE-PGRS family protein PE_PGRS46-like [Mercenaria mercenaria]
MRNEKESNKSYVVVFTVTYQLKLGGGQTGSASWQWNTSGGSAAGRNQGVSLEANRKAIESLLAQLKQTGGRSGSPSSSWQWNTSGGSASAGTGSVDANRKAIESLLAQLQLAGGQGGKSSWQWTSTGGTAAGQELDMAKLNAILKQMQETATSSGTSSFNTSGTFVTSGGQSAIISVGMGSNTGAAGGNTGSKRTVQVRQETQQPTRTETIVGGRVVGGAFGGAVSGSSSGGQQTGGVLVQETLSRGGSGGQGRQTGGVLVQETLSRGGSGGQGRQTGGVLVQETSSRGGSGGQGRQTGGVLIQETSSRGGSGGQGTGQFETRFTAQGSRPSTSDSGTVVSLVKQTVQGEARQGIPDRSAPRGAEARGVRKQADGRIVGISVPAHSEFVSGATVIGKGEKTVRVTNTQPQIRIKEIVQEVNPMMFEATGGFASGGASGSGTSSWQTSGSSQSGGTFGAASGSASGASSGGSGQFVGRQIITDATGMAGGDFTQMGKVVGSGGGVKRVIDTNVKRMPAGEVQFNAEGGVSLASLGLGGAEGANIIRQTMRIEPAGNGQFTGEGGQFQGSLSGSSSGSSGGGSQGFISANTLNQGLGGAGQGGSFSASRSFSGSSGSGGAGIMDMNALNRGGQGSITSQRSMSAQGNSNLFPLLPLIGDSAENFIEGLGGKRKRRSTRKSRAKRAANKQNYQALVTNCQGQDGQGPSIMVVANKGDVQFALKTYNHDPAVLSVPAVEGWNDVTLIYDGRALTGVVENWKGLHKASVNLQDTQRSTTVIFDIEGGGSSKLNIMPKWTLVMEDIGNPTTYLLRYSNVKPHALAF